MTNASQGQPGDRAQYAYDFYRKRGYSAAASAGIVGNLNVESGGFADDVINGTRRGDSGTAFGIAQHRHERLANMERFAASRGTTITDFDTQLAFVDHEMRTGSDAGAARAFAALQNPNITASQAAAAFMTHFERPHADPNINHVAKRQSFAEMISGAPAYTGLRPSISTPASANPGDFNVTTPGKISNTDITPAVNLTDTEQAKIDEAMEDNSPGFAEGAWLAAKNQMSIFTPFRMIGHYDPDPNLKVDEEMVRRWSRDLPTDTIDEFSDAVSEEHAQAIRARIKQQLKDNERLGSMGTTGVVLNTAAAILDPGAIAASVALGAVTSGVGGAALMAGRAGRAGMVALTAAEAVAGNVLTEAPLIAVDPTRDASWDELKYAIGAGLIMGGSFGALRRNPVMKDEAIGIKKLGHQMTGTSALTPANKSAGAAHVMGENTTRGDTLDVLQDYQQFTTGGAFLKGRFDVVGQMLASKNPVVQKLARLLGEDAVGAKKGSGVVTETAASERMTRRYRQAQANWSMNYLKAERAYRKRLGISSFNKQKVMEFRYSITDYIRATDAERTDVNRFSPETRQAALSFQTEMKHFWSEAQELGLTRSEMGVKDYMPRYAHLSSAKRLISAHGFDKDGGGLTQLFAKAILKKQPEIKPDIANCMGYAILDRMNKLHAGQEMMGNGHLGFDLDDLEVELKNYLSEDEIANVKAWVSRDQKAKDGASSSSRMHHRIDLDESEALTFRDKYGQPHEVSISDFYIRDPNTAFNLYARNMSGQLALARVQVIGKAIDEETGEMVDKVILNGIKNSGDVAKLREQIKSVGAHLGANNEKDLENFDFMISAITGQPYYNRNSDWAAFLRVLRDFNFIRLMGQVGFSQLPEFGRMASQVGIKAMYQGMPAFRDLIENMKTGKFTDELAEEMHVLGAYGSDWERGAIHLEADEFGTPITYGGDTMMQRVAAKTGPAMHQATRFVSMASGMMPVNRVFQKWSARAATVKFARMALKGDKISDARLASLGLDRPTLEAILKEITEKATFKKAGDPGSLTALNIKEWDNRTLASFEDALFRINRTMIMENDPGQFAKWMAHPFGQTMMQFRTFAAAAYTKGLMRGLNHNDMQAWMGALSGAFLGAIVYKGQTWLNTRGDPDGDRKFKERTTLANLGKAGFQRMAESSLLTMPLDMGSELLTGNPMFDMRSSGLKTSIDNLTANPTQDLLSSAYRGIKGVTTAIAGDDYSNPDFQALTRTLPFNRMQGFVQFFNWISSDLPRRELRD